MSRRRLVLGALVVWAVAGPGSATAVTVSGEDEVMVVAAGVAAADAVASQAAVGNQVDDRVAARQALIEGSLRDNVGVVNVNQDAGNLNSQANLHALALVASPALHGVLALAEAWVGGEQRDNVAVAVGAVREDLLRESGDRSRGLLGLNQSAGSLNRQANVFVVAFGGVVTEGALVGLQDATLGDVKSGNSVDDRVALRQDVVLDSFRGFTGAALVSQVSGELNTVRHVLTLSVLWGTAPAP